MLSLDGAEHARHRAPFVAAFRLGDVRERLAAAVAEETDAAARRAGAGAARASCGAASRGRWRPRP